MNDTATFAAMIGDRIALARSEAELSQVELAAKLGFNDRQTVSAMEGGVRAVSAEELVRLGEILGRPLEFFTDPHLLVEKGEFSYRTTAASAKLPQFEETARRLLEANHRFRHLLDEPASPLVGQLREVTAQTTPEMVCAFGHQLSRRWDLGDSPAKKLSSMIEAQLHVLVLHVDAPAGVSGAACRLREGDVVLLNRQEPAFRRNWTLAHELFHLLTWSELPPPRVDPELAETAAGKPKVEKQADAFAAGLLMPLTTTRTVWACTSGEVHQRILKCADHFQVSGQAAFYRLRTLGCLGREQSAKVDQAKLSRNRTEGGPTPPLYNAELVRRLHAVLERGMATVRYAADALDTDIEGLRELFAVYGLDVPFDL